MGSAWRTLAAVLLLPLLVSGCGGSADVSAPPPETIAREAFVTTYVDLRMAALRDSTGGITPEERERVLESHGITAADLLRFVEVWGEEDPGSLQEVWADVQERIREAREEAALERIESDPAGSPFSPSDEAAGSGDPGDS